MYAIGITITCIALIISPYITGIIIEEEVSLNLASYFDSCVNCKFPTELILHLAGGLLDIGCGLCGERPDLCVSGARRGARMELYPNSRN